MSHEIDKEKITNKMEGSKSLITIEDANVKVIDRWIKAYKAAYGYTPSKSIVIGIALDKHRKEFKEAIKEMNKVAAAKVQV